MLHIILPKIISTSRYMVLCKVMNNNEDEVSNILSAKLSIKFSGVEIEAMKVLTPIGPKKIHDGP